MANIVDEICMMLVNTDVMEDSTVRQLKRVQENMYYIIRQAQLFNEKTQWEPVATYDPDKEDYSAVMLFNAHNEIIYIGSYCTIRNKWYSWGQEQETELPHQETITHWRVWVEAPPEIVNGD